MQDAFMLLVILVVAVGGVVALYTAVTSGQAYREIGKGGLDAPAAAEPPASPAPPDDRDEEIRELLEARNARRERRGEAPLDVEEQLAMLNAGAGTDELRDELRALVQARNQRRARAGLEALDVDAEVERRLRELK
jgi:uncharacterized protein YkwD